MIKLTQINFVVRDLSRIVENWNRLLGSEPAMQYQQNDGSDAETYTDGEKTKISGVNVAKYFTGAGLTEDTSTVVLAFWEPGEHDSPWKRHLDKYGEGFMDLEFISTDRLKVYKDIGIEPYHVGFMEHFTYSMVEARGEFATDFNIGQLEGIDLNTAADKYAFSEYRKDV